MRLFLRRFFRSPWIRTLFGVVTLCVLIWLFGPLLGFGEAHPLDSELVRIILIAVLMVLWLVLNLVRELRHSKKDKELVEGVAAPPADPDARASAEETALLADRLKEALHALKKTKLGGKSGKYLYQLPWYMFIGPPGAGKTTALVNSGLNFPLSEQHGPEALKGVGGTRNCDWWFTDQAVLIDTAGRYTTQDSQAAVDSAAWMGFLKLLKQHRKRQPLNGVIVAVSLTDLSELGDSDRLAHARAIRKRLRELHDELGVRIPVYVLFTKADMMAGFVDFFDSLGKEERDQVWGMTFPLDDGKSDDGIVARFRPEFDLLLARLNDRMLERVHQEPDIQRRRQIYGFPQQLASLREVAGDFLDEIFRPSRLEARPLLRGAYFTSGTQNGTPIDRLLGTMAGQFGLQREAVTAFSGVGRSYFLTRCFREVMFGEAGLVSQDPKVERRATLIHVGTYAACGVLLLLLALLWTMSYFGNTSLIAQVHDESALYDTQYKDLVARGPQDTDIPATLPALGTLRTIKGGYADRESSVPLTITFGLYQGQKLSAAAIDAYYRGLGSLLLPRLLARLEGQMRAHLDKPDFLYEALKVYLILGKQGPLDRDVVMQWMNADFSASYPGDDGAETREAILAHVEALMQRPLPASVPLDGPLVAQVRGILTQEPLATYSYNRIMRSPRVASLPAWTVADNAGPGGGRVFQLRSGKSLQDGGVPGVFTWSGYHSTFLPLLPTVTQYINEDRWVLGQPPQTVAGSLAEITKLRRDVLGLFLDDYTRQWDGLLGDVTIKPFGNLQQGLDELNLLAAPDSPLRDLLQSIDTQTQLSRSSAVDQVEGKSEAKLAKAAQSAAGFASVTARAGLTTDQNALATILGETFSGGDPNAKPVDPATRVDQHFKMIHDFVAGSGGGTPPPMEAAIGKIQAIYQNFSQVANSTNQGQALLGVVGGAASSAAGGGGGSASQQLDQLATGLPKPIATMLQTVSQSSSSVTASGATQELSDAWRSKVLPLCQAAFNRYPFVAGSSSDVPLDDFTRLLGPNGLMDQFFNDNLKPLVDTTQTPWRWQAADNTKLGLSPATLTEFEAAASIRDALFGSGGNQIMVKFQLVPESLDPQLGQISLDIAGENLTYNHGPTESMQFQWPGANGKTLTRVTMTPAAGGKETIIEKDGPWALLRLLDAARLIPSGDPDRFRVVFSSPSGDASFQLNASSVRNPFTMTALRSFRCPAKL